MLLPAFLFNIYLIFKKTRKNINIIQRTVNKEDCLFFRCIV